MMGGPNSSPRFLGEGDQPKAGGGAAAKPPREELASLAAPPPHCVGSPSPAKAGEEL
jgi:hypothetical protein